MEFCHNDATAASFLGVSNRTIFNLRLRGELPYSKIGRRTVIQHSDILALLKRTRRSADAA